MSEIYVIENTITKKKYVGKANKYVSKNNNKWGAAGRWGSHITEALNPNSRNSCVLLNNAIRKYGKDAFKVTVIDEVPISEVGEKEAYYIKELNTIVPNGYNIREGGDDGKHVRYEIDEDIVVGEQRLPKTRKNPEDANLPKNIIALRTEGKITGYKIEVVIKTAEKEHFTKTFRNKEDPAKALEQAIEELEKLKIEHANQFEANIKKKRVVVNENTVIDEYIRPIMKEYKIAGYVVKGMKDPSGNDIPPKIFDSNTNRWNLDKAKKYVTQVKNIVEKGIPVSDWNNIDTIPRIHKKGVDNEYLPKYMRALFVRGIKIGYAIDGYVVAGKKINQRFVNESNTIEELYDQAMAFLKELNDNIGMKQQA